MKIKLSILVAFAFSAALAPSLLVNAQDSDSYQLIAVKDCQVVKTQMLTDKQTQAYLELQDAEFGMAGLEKPLDGMQARMDSLSKQMEALSEKAVVETEDSVHINKALLAKQERLAEEIQNLVKAHQKDFDAIEEMGDKISKVAARFEASLDGDFDGTDYDYVQIKSAAEARNFEPCSNI